MPGNGTLRRSMVWVGQRARARQRCTSAARHRRGAAHAHPWPAARHGCARIQTWSARSARHVRTAWDRSGIRTAPQHSTVVRASLLAAEAPAGRAQARAGAGCPDMRAQCLALAICACLSPMARVSLLPRLADGAVRPGAARYRLVCRSHRGSCHRQNDNTPGRHPRTAAAPVGPCPARLLCPAPVSLRPGRGARM
jgi:hypothetical protein